MARPPIYRTSVKPDPDDEEDQQGKDYEGHPEPTKEQREANEKLMRDIKSGKRKVKTIDLDRNRGPRSDEEILK